MIGLPGPHRPLHECRYILMKDTRAGLPRIEPREFQPLRVHIHAGDPRPSRLQRWQRPAAASEQVQGFEIADVVAAFQAAAHPPPALDILRGHTHAPARLRSTLQRVSVDVDQPAIRQAFALRHPCAPGGRTAVDPVGMPLRLGPRPRGLRIRTLNDVWSEAFQPAPPTEIDQLVVVERRVNEGVNNHGVR